MDAFEEWWGKHLYRGDLHRMAREAYLAATERAAGIAEKHGEDFGDTGSCADRYESAVYDTAERIAAKIRGEEGE